MSKKTVILRAMIPCLLWGSVFPIIKLLIAEVGVSESTSGKLTLAGIRFFLAGIIMLSIAAFRDKKFPKLPKKNFAVSASVGLLSTTALYGLYYIGFGYVTGVKASILTQVDIFYVLILAAILLGEKLRPGHYYGMLFGFMGVIMLNVSVFSDSDALFSFSVNGEGAILLAGVFGALGQIVVKKFGSKIPALTLNGWQMTIGGGILLIVGVISNGGFIQLDSWKSILLLAYSILVAAVGFTLWFGLIQKVDVNEVTLFRLTIPVIGSIVSALVLPEEMITINVAIALVLVFIGMYFVNRPSSSQEENIECMEVDREL